MANNNNDSKYVSAITFIRQLRRMMPPEPYGSRPKPSAPEPVPSPSLTDLSYAIHAATKLPSRRRPVSRLRATEAAARGENFVTSVVAHTVIPDTRHHWVDRHRMGVYGGKFVGEDGDRFVTSCQDKHLRVYKTNLSECEAAWQKTHDIRAEGVRWTITDFDVSPNGRWLVYSTLNRWVHLVDLEQESRPQIDLDFSTTNHGRLDIWSLKFSCNGQEIIAGTSEGRMRCHGRIIVYDIQIRRVVEVIEAHEDDVNSVCYMQKTASDLILSGADDALVKMWDRRDAASRLVREMHRPCGLFIGHQFGLTCVSSKDDGRFFLSNGKDQFIKLWDARKCISQSNFASIRLPPRDPGFDYRVQEFPRLATTSGNFRDDSVMTYAGEHTTLQTLIRAHFSPVHTTGQKYIYCGSSDGRCVIYDVLTGKMVKVLDGHVAPVRDVSWHPYGCFLTTSSWDGGVLLWSTECAKKDKESAGPS